MIGGKYNIQFPGIYDLPFGAGYYIIDANAMVTHVPNGSDGYHHPLCMLPITTKEINLGWYSVFSTIGVASEWDKFKPYKVKPTGYYDESVSV